MEVLWRFRVSRDRAKLVLERHMEHWMEVESALLVYKVKDLSEFK